jgi:predicted HTH domain antitoxin
MCYNMRIIMKRTRSMAVITEPVTIYDILALTRGLPAADRRWLADLLGQDSDTLLPEHATLDEAIALYLADVCSLARAAELAGLTRWDLQDRLKERGIPLVMHGGQSAQDMDALAAQLEREGLL